MWVFFQGYEKGEARNKRLLQEAAGAAQRDADDDAGDLPNTQPAQHRDQENIDPVREAAYTRPIKRRKKRNRPGIGLRDGRYVNQGQINKTCHGCKNNPFGKVAQGTSLTLQHSCGSTFWARDMSRC